MILLFTHACYCCTCLKHTTCSKTCEQPPPPLMCVCPIWLTEHISATHSHPSPVPALPVGIAWACHHLPLPAAGVFSGFLPVEEEDQGYLPCTFMRATSNSTLRTHSSSLRHPYLYPHYSPTPTTSSAVVLHVVYTLCRDFTLWKVHTGGSGGLTQVVLLLHDCAAACHILFNPSPLTYRTGAIYLFVLQPSPSQLNLVVFCLLPAHADLPFVPFV